MHVYEGHNTLYFKTIIFVTLHPLIIDLKDFAPFAKNFPSILTKNYFLTLEITILSL